MSIDLHLHTTASDGTDTPAELVKKLHEAGIYTFSITDHDTVSGLSQARAALLPEMELINGVELSAVYKSDGLSFKCHILGYGFDEKGESILSAIAQGIALRKSKMERRLDYLSRRFGIVFGSAEREYLAKQENTNKLLIADLIIKRGLAKDYEEAISRYLRAEDFPDALLPAFLAVRAIKESGGVAVYAHCLGGEGEKRITPLEARPRIDALCELGIVGLEAYYSRYCKAEREGVAALARERGLAISCGSDYHGMRKTVGLGQLSSDGTAPKREEITLLELLKLGS